MYSPKCSYSNVSPQFLCVLEYVDTVRQNAEVVSYMVSVERISSFCDIPSEADLYQADDKKLGGWPQQGRIDISHLTVRYRDNLPPSLSDISCSIPRGSRVGICGRTGGGKSTLVQALFRILEADSGSIFIDGTDISSVGLHKLRRALSVIPQTPTLFSGYNVRENLDPFKVYSDEAIRNALSDVQMSGAIDMLPGGLDCIVLENGSNFSVGQRQLLCLARAILRRNKVLVLGKILNDYWRLVSKNCRRPALYAFYFAIAALIAFIIRFITTKMSQRRTLIIEQITFFKRLLDEVFWIQQF